MVVVVDYSRGSGLTWVLCVPLFRLVKGPASGVFDNVGNVLTLDNVGGVDAITLVQFWCTGRCKGGDGHQAERLLGEHVFVFVSFFSLGKRRVMIRVV